MQYQSFIRLFKYCNVDYDTWDIRKIKKILSAEFSIAENGIITIDGFDYNKNDIFQELDRSDASERLAFHKIIWDHPYLMDCLETNTVDLFNVHTWIKLQYDSGFVHFISPYFVDTFNKIMRHCLDPVNFKEAANWFRMLAFIDNPEDEHNALKNVRLYTAHLIKCLKNSNKDTYSRIRLVLKPWVDQSGYLFVNNFPQSLDDLKRELTVAFMRFTIEIQKENKVLCYDLSCQLVQFNLDPELHEKIMENHRIFTNNAEIAGGGGPRVSGNAVWAIAILLIGFIRLAFFLSPNNGNSYTSNYSYSSVRSGESVSSGYYSDIQKKYEVIDSANFNLVENEPLLVISNEPYFMIFERSDTTSAVHVKIVNNGQYQINLYVRGRDGLVSQIVVNRKETYSIRNDRNVLDLLLSNCGEGKPFEYPQLMLISDKLNVSTRKVNLGYGTRAVSLNSPDSNGSENEFILEVFQENRGSMSLDYIRFKNAEWVY